MGVVDASVDTAGQLPTLFHGVWEMVSFEWLLRNRIIWGLAWEDAEL